MPSPPALRLRLIFDSRRALGPGKIDLLEAIAKTGTITGAARAMCMSYKRAWQLVDELNRCFAVALVETSKGGERGGGATLSPSGEKVVAAYRAIERKAQRATLVEIHLLARLARGSAKR